jgi:hypothetical protein
MWTSGHKGGTNQIGTYYNDTESTAWGLGWEQLNAGGGIDPALIQHREWDTDRGGNAGKAQKDILVSGAKSYYTHPGIIARGGRSLSR